MQDPPAHLNQDEFYSVRFLPQGVFVTMPRLADTHAIKPKALLYDLQRRGISGLRPGSIVVALRRGDMILHVAPQQEEKTVPGDLYIVIAKDAMTAEAQLLPPCKGGAQLTAQEARDKLAQAGICYGVDDEALEALVAEGAYYRSAIVARGMQPQRGEDGRLEMLFDSAPNRKPQEREDGSVDYKEVKTFTLANPGDKLVQRHPAGMGKPGRGVTGLEAAAPQGDVPPLPQGENVAVGKDGESLVATREGRVALRDGLVHVCDVYTVEGDVDLSVGNVDFSGDVVVKGHVISGFSVKAGGNIEVHGNVEGARLEAGGDITLRQGMQGADKGSLKAGGQIISSFLARLTARAGGDIYVDYMLHCDVIAGGSIVAKGKRGRIIGGHVSAVKDIVTRVLGSPAGEKTLVEMGDRQDYHKVYDTLIAQRERVRVVLEDVERRVRMERNEESEEGQRAREEFAQVQVLYQRVTGDMERIQERISALRRCKVYVPGQVFQDVKVTIDRAVFSTKNPMEHVTFSYRDGEITPY